MFLSLLLAQFAFADPDLKKCADPAAQRLLEQGMDLQRDLESDSALRAYSACLEKEPGCVACQYESGWSFWKLGEWEQVVKVWERALELAPKHSDIPQYMLTAKENLALVKAKRFPLLS